MIHLVLNNQVGFTTAPHDGRSSAHATCAGKAIGAPIFHVNADDPEAVVAACQMAADFRHRWHKDVIVDVIGYRRWVSRSALSSPDVLPQGVMIYARSVHGLWAPQSPAWCSAPQQCRSEELRTESLRVGSVQSIYLLEGEITCRAGMGTMSWTIRRLPCR